MLKFLSDEEASILEFVKNNYNEIKKLQELYVKDSERFSYLAKLADDNSVLLRLITYMLKKIPSKYQTDDEKLQAVGHIFDYINLIINGNDIENIVYFDGTLRRDALESISLFIKESLAEETKKRELINRKILGEYQSLIEERDALLKENEDLTGKNDALLKENQKLFDSNQKISENIIALDGLITEKESRLDELRVPAMTIIDSETKQRKEAAEAELAILEERKNAALESLRSTEKRLSALYDVLAGINQEEYEVKWVNAVECKDFLGCGALDVRDYFISKINAYKNYMNIAENEVSVIFGEHCPGWNEFAKRIKERWPGERFSLKYLYDNSNYFINGVNPRFVKDYLDGITLPVFIKRKRLVTELSGIPITIKGELDLSSSLYVFSESMRHKEVAIEALTKQNIAEFKYRALLEYVEKLLPEKVDEIKRYDAFTTLGINKVINESAFSFQQTGFNETLGGADEDSMNGDYAGIKL